MYVQYQTIGYCTSGSCCWKNHIFAFSKWKKFKIDFMWGYVQGQEDETGTWALFSKYYRNIIGNWEYLLIIDGVLINLIVVSQLLSDGEIGNAIIVIRFVKDIITNQPLVEWHVLLHVQGIFYN